jgi:hypothetical protein
VTAERTEEGKRRAVAEGRAPFPNLPFYLRRRGGKKRPIEHDPRRVELMREAVRMRLDDALLVAPAARLGIRLRSATTSYSPPRCLP